MGKIDEEHSTCSAHVSCSSKVIEPLLSAGSLFFFFPGPKAVELN
jgi:hypothetical protein